jgi:asparagine synthase (glutamine-hydrolysing)
MSGVTGYWGYSSHDLSAAVFAAFTHSLAHRGPDGFGIEHFPEVRLWLGHRRLAILDLSERARQPMSYAEGRYWLTYNGEVYNYIELREELRSLGHRFVSDSDSEVILAAYAQWGQECLFRFNGMWAFAIWDAHERQLFLSRDRFGVKPLHYSDHAGAFAFASELKAFLTLPWIDGAFDPEIVAETLTNINGQEVTPYTLLPGVRRLPAGHAMLVEADGSIRINAWWNTLDHLPQPRAKLDEQAEEFRALFFDACRLRLRSDVPLATALSGGLDSSAIACTLAELHRRGAIEGAPQDSQRAFVACFPGTPYDERQYAERVVDHTGLTPHYHNVDDDQVVNNIEKVIFGDERIYWFPRVGSWTLYRAMRQAGIRASLDGEAGDGLLGSAREYIEAATQTAADHFNLMRYWELRGVLRGLAGGNVGFEHVTHIGEFPRLARYLLKRPGAMQFVRAVVETIRTRPHRTTSADFLLRPYAGPLRLYYEDSDPRVQNMTRLQAMLFTNFHGTALPTTAASFDRASMAHGIESRMPFFDWRLVTYAFALADTSRNGGGYSKRLLRLAMQGVMPDVIRLRKTKVGFISPLDHWVRGALKSWVLDLCTSRAFLENSVWNGPAIRAVVERATTGGADIYPVWPMLNAHALQQSFAARAQKIATSGIVPAEQDLTT